jgi:predicted RNA binding protein YcfA (HicA-like mRNA interferase family)
MGKRARKLPILTADDIAKVLRADGWHRVDGTKHLAFEHPRKRGKVLFGANWAHVRPTGDPLRGILRTAELSQAEFERLYWQMRGR